MFESVPLLVVLVCVCLAFEGLATAVLRTAWGGGMLLLKAAATIWNGIRHSVAS